MPTDQFKLIFNGQQMEEVKKLVDYKIGPGSTIIMVPSLRGGWLNSYCYYSNLNHSNFWFYKETHSLVNSLIRSNYIFFPFISNAKILK